METSNEVKILGMLGEMNNKLSSMDNELKEMKEIMFKNFTALADTEVTTYNKLNEMSESLKNIEFRVGVTEAGVSLNSKEIQGITNNIKL